MERVTSTENTKWCHHSQDIKRNGTELSLQGLFKGISSVSSISSYLAQLEEISPTTAVQEDKNAFQLTEDAGSNGNGSVSGTDTNFQQLTPADIQVRGGNGTNDNFYSAGMNRVPSLEFLKMVCNPSNALYSTALPLGRTLQDQQSGSEAFVVNPANGAIKSSPSVSAASLPIAHPQGGIIPPAPHSTILAVNPNEAAALQYSQFTSSGVLPQGIDLDFWQKTEQRRAKRMLSNRESARRSRKRKQEHLTTLQVEIDALKDEKRYWLETNQNLKRRCKSAEEECGRLKEENVRLREELNILNVLRKEILQSRKSLSTVQEVEKSSEK